MNPLVREWAAKAEGDFATAQREIRGRKALSICRAVRAKALERLKLRP